MEETTLAFVAPLLEPCRCGEPATGTRGKGRRRFTFCRGHMPTDLRLFQEGAMRALLRGAARRKARLPAAPRSG